MIKIVDGFLIHEDQPPIDLSSYSISCRSEYNDEIFYIEFDHILFENYTIEWEFANESLQSKVYEAIQEILKNNETYIESIQISFDDKYSLRKNKPKIAIRYQG